MKKTLFLFFFSLFLLACHREFSPEPPLIKNKIKYSNILILGNSITVAAANPAIGWNANHGMAASQPELDYVHQLTKRLKFDTLDIQLSAHNIAEFEFEYQKYDAASKLQHYAKSIPDLVIFRIGENVDQDKIADQVFKQKYQEMINYFRSINPSVDILSVGSFWRKEKTDKLMKAITESNKGYFISLGHLGAQRSYSAWKQYKHRGVSVHPGDYGMKVIADIIYKQIVKQSL